MTSPIPPPETFLEVEALVVDILEADPAVSNALIAVEPPAGFDGTAAAVLVNRRGGAWIGDLHVDEPLIELEVYGPTKAAAHTLANAGRRAVLAAAGRTYGTNLITDVVEEDGPRWLPDYLYRAANRYVCVLKVSVNVY
ncbi:hypothetical protein ACOT81_18255 [Streptomyces sp. WI04-05B]|uniref:hypothetical protein n=1 Tax=Streptomyces TaxID=1883 RepID=UPI0029BAEBC6|nr:MULTISPECIES: hypothetical protein [unclassified Streptomyces]MDX2542670.1 hypothetical protein [Streptomyces sp. WI04-05B]MDX2582311.1 hypothetical protein [Streptomyces sp. WI04-05A]MDX3747724.1 hypothetical protein [Streptomyces sp. AK08-02]